MTSSAVSNTLLSPYRPIRSVEIQPSLLLPVGGKYHFAFLSCGTCLPAMGDQLSADRSGKVGGEPGTRDVRFRCPECGRGRRLAHPWAHLAADVSTPDRRKWGSERGRSPALLPLPATLVERAKVAEQAGDQPGGGHHQQDVVIHAHILVVPAENY